MIVYQCEDSIESIFTAIYNAYEEKRDHSDTRISLADELLLFAEYVPVVADSEKAIKVIRTLKKKFGEGDYHTICYALSSPSEEKGQAVYQTIVEGLKVNPAPGRLFDNLTHDAIHKVFALSRGAGNECNHLYGFVRFQELENGVLYSKIGPKNNVLTFLMPHFSDRLPMENFMIYDENRDLFGIHPAKAKKSHPIKWYLVQGETLLGETLLRKGSSEEGLSGDQGSALLHKSDLGRMGWGLSADEKLFQDLFRHFCKKIAVEERKNLSLQRNNLPLRFQEYMIEFT